MGMDCSMNRWESPRGFLVPVIEDHLHSGLIKTTCSGTNAQEHVLPLPEV